jgi:hypothetical protein
MGCTTARNSDNVWIYLRNWKESTELSVKVDYVRCQVRQHEFI